MKLPLTIAYLLTFPTSQQSPTTMPTTTDSYRHLVTEITIHASADKVWDVLMDFQSYPTWNPFIRSIVGTTRVAQQLTNVMQPEGQKPQTFKPVIVMAETNTHFAWKGKLWVKGLFDGEHHFELKQISPTETVLIQHEYFSGILVPMFKTMLSVNTKNSFEAMNKALKERVEALTKDGAGMQP